jgi:hypothetical protein
VNSVQGLSEQDELAATKHVADPAWSTLWTASRAWTWEARAGESVPRPLAGGPDQERSGEHVPDQAGTRDFTFCSELALQVEQLIAVPIANPSRIEPEQHAYQTRVHTGWTPIRARPTRVILSSRLSWSVSAAVPAAVIS